MIWNKNKKEITYREQCSLVYFTEEMHSSSVLSRESPVDSENEFPHGHNNTLSEEKTK